MTNDKRWAVFFGVFAIAFLVAIVTLPDTTALVPAFGLMCLYVGYFLGRAVKVRSA